MLSISLRLSRWFSRVVVPMEDKVKIKKKKHSDLNELKRHLQLTSHKRQDAGQLYEQIPHREVYRRMDSSLDSFFLKRQYSLPNFNFLLNVLAEQAAPEKIPAVLDKMSYLQLQPDETTYTYMIKAAANKGDVKLAEKYFATFRQRFPANKHAYTSLMMAYVRTGDSDNAQAIVLEMEQNGMVPDLPLFTTLMNAHLKARKLSKCWQLHRHVEKQGMALDETYVSVLMQVYASSHDTEKAIKLYREHIETSKEQPLLQTTNAYLKALAVRPDYSQQAIDLFFNIIQKDSLINSSTILHALRACTEASDIKSAVEVVKIMRHKGIQPNKFIYNAMIRCYASACAIPDLELQTVDLFINDAWKLLEEVGRKGLIDSKMLNNFMVMYVYAMRGDEIDGLVLPLFDKYKIEKDQYTYQYLLKLFEKKQDMVGFSRIWELQEKHLQQKRDTYLKEQGTERQNQLATREQFRPTFDSVCMYLESGIKLMDKDRIIKALEIFKAMKRMPKTKHLKFLGELKGLPVEIQAELIDFKMQFGATRGNRGVAPLVLDPQNR